MYFKENTTNAMLPVKRIMDLFLMDRNLTIRPAKRTSGSKSLQHTWGATFKETMPQKKKSLHA